MTHRLTAGLLALSLAAVPTLSFAQATATTAAPAAAPAAPAPTTPAVAPADTTAPASATTPAERPSTYTVESGDSLWTIAHKFGTTVVKLRKLNDLKKGALLHPGQELKLPPATADSSSK